MLTRRCAQLFLAELEVAQANEVIHRLDLQTLPHIFYIPASANLEGDGKIKIPAEDIMQVRSNICFACDCLVLDVFIIPH